MQNQRDRNVAVNVSSSFSYIPYDDSEDISFQQCMDKYFIYPSIYLWIFRLFSGEGNGTPLQYSCLQSPMMEEPGRLQSIGSLRIGHD